MADAPPEGEEGKEEPTPRTTEDTPAEIEERKAEDTPAEIEERKAEDTPAEIEERKAEDAPEEKAEPKAEDAPEQKEEPIEEKKTTEDSPEQKEEPIEEKKTMEGSPEEKEKTDETKAEDSPEVKPDETKDKLPEKEEELAPRNLASEKSKPEKQQDSKKKDVKRLFDSKGSLLVSESHAKTTLEELKKKRAAVSAQIKDLKDKVTAFKKKDNPTDEDMANLKKYHDQILDKMAEYDDITKTVERLMGMPEVRSSEITITSVLSTPPLKKTETPPKPLVNIEEKLPKIIVCGTDMGNSIPRIIVCEPLNKKHTEPFYDDKRPSKGPPIQNDELEKEKLKEALEAQKKLAAQNHELNQMSLRMQQELFAKQEQLEKMKQQMMAYECENYRMQNENCELQRKVMSCRQPSGESKTCKRELNMKFGGQSPEISKCCCTNNIQSLGCRCKGRQ